ncbi:MAG: bifunctional DNA primase/polymerase [Ardenticatenaceae bacterium]
MNAEYLPVRRDELLVLSESVIVQGLSLIPLGRDKKPFWPLIPSVPKIKKNGTVEMKKSWKALLQQGPTTVEDVRRWLDAGASGLAAACGNEFSNGLYAFDIDVSRFLDKWVTGEVEALLNLIEAPFQMSGGGGYQIYVIVQGVVPKARRLAWVADPSQESGRSIAIETRGEGNYIVLPHSIHPNGTYYNPYPRFGGTFHYIPVITQEELKMLSDAASATCEAPKSTRDIEREQKRRKREAERARRKASAYQIVERGESVIDRVNRVFDIEDVLADCGYTILSSGRWSHPSGKSGTVEVTSDNKSVHYSTNDPMCDGYPKSPFALLCYYKHDDDVKDAVKALAEELNMDYASQRRDRHQDQKSAHKAGLAPALNPSPTQAPQQAPIWATQKPAPALVPVREPLPEWPTPVTYENFDWKAFRQEVIRKFDVAKYVREHFSFDGQEVIKVDAARNLFWHPQESLGGGTFQIVCYKLYGHTKTSKHWSKILREAARFAGVEWPDFRVLGCTLFDVLRMAQQQADNFYVIELSDGQYLSDVLNYNDLAWGKTTIIIATCGVGKTTAADVLGEKSFYAPMARQAITFAQSANARGVASEAVYEGFIHDGSPSIFGTYDAARKEIERINSKENPLDVSHRTSIFDEIQHTGHDRFRKATALEPILKVAQIYVNAGGRVITLSGTPSPAYPSLIAYKGSDIIYVRRINSSQRNFWLFHQSDPVEAIIDRIRAGYTHIAYSIDDKAKCEAIAKTLSKKGFKALSIHSDNKNTDFHKKHVGEMGDGQWDESVVAHITTRATVDGFSVRIGDKPDVKLAEMFDATLQYGSQMIEQRSRRVRDHLADAFVGMSDKALEKLDKGGHFDFTQKVNSELERGRMVLNVARILKVHKVQELEEEALKLGDEIQNANQIANNYVVKHLKAWIKFNEEGDLELDELAIIQRITSQWVAASHATPDIMINELSSYGFQFKGVVDLTGNQADASARKNAIKQEKKARKEAELTEIKKQAQTMSIVQAHAVHQQMTTVIREEGDKGKAKVAAAGMILSLTEKGVTEKEAKKQISALTSTRKDKIERIENVIQMAKIRQAISPELFERGDPKTRFLATLQDGETFKIGEVLTSREIVARVRATAETCRIPEIMVPLTIEEKKRLKKAKKSEKRYDNDRKVIQLMKDIYQLKRTSKMIDGLKVDLYEVHAFIEIELNNNNCK